MKKILIIDSHNMLHRARFGFGDGPHKIFFNFFRMLKGELKNHDSDLVYIVDEGKALISRELMPEYKANRQKLKDPQFWREKDEVFETIKLLSGFTYIRHPHRECDDVIGHLASVVHRHDDVVIVSNDSDFIQLISDNVRVWDPRKKKYLEPWYCDYLTWKALRGDPTDNIPGVYGIGNKRADKLAQNPAMLDDLLNDEAKRRQFELSYQLIKLKEVSNNGLQIVQETFHEKKMFEEFQKRNCKTIIGKAWPKWVEAFKGAGGKNGFATKNAAEHAADVSPT